MTPNEHQNRFVLSDLVLVENFINHHVSMLPTNQNLYLFERFFAYQSKVVISTERIAGENLKDDFLYFSLIILS